MGRIIATSMTKPYESGSGSDVDKAYVDKQDQAILKEAKEYTDSKIPPAQFTDEQARLLTLLSSQIHIDKNSEGDDYFTGFKTQFKIVNEFDETKMHINSHYAQTILYDPESGKELMWIQNGKILYKDVEIANLQNIYQKVFEVTVNDTKWVFDAFDNSKWYMFNVEYVGGDNKNYSGSLERMAGITLDIRDCNVANDFGASSSATMTFDGNTKTLEVKRWEQTSLKITKVTVFSKLVN
jgi:hypothetical protein